MTNKLIRTGGTYLVPAQPYIPPTPGYTTTQTITVLDLPPANGGVYVPSGRPGFTPITEKRIVDGVEVEVVIGYRPIPTTANDPNGGTRTITITTYHPPTPGQPGRAAQRVDIPPQGWTAFAKSIKSLVGAVVATFKSRVGISGAAVGLANASFIPRAGYTHLRQGLLLSGNTVRNLRTGASLGTFTASDVFSIVLGSSGVTFKKNGSDIGTDPGSFYVPGEELRMSAALYGATDEIDAPTFEPAAAGGTSLAVFPALTAKSADAPHAESYAVFPALRAISRTGNTSLAVFPALAAKSSETTFADSFAEFPPLTAESYNTLSVERNQSSLAQLPPLHAVSILLVGHTGTSMAVFPSMKGLSADRAYGMSRAKFPALRALSYDMPEGLVYAFDDLVITDNLGLPPGNTVVCTDDLVFGDHAGPTSVTTVQALDSLAFSVSAAAEAIHEVDATDTLVFDVTVATFVLQTAEAFDSTVFSCPITVTGTNTVSIVERILFSCPMTAFGTGDGIETWAVNASNNGSTRYRNYPFNSFARIGGKYYGASIDGIYELDGPDDAGEPIQAAISMGQRDFGSPVRKTVSLVYLGLASEGKMTLRLEAEGKTYNYETRGDSKQMQQQRITCGKGLRTNYVTPTLFNQEGQNFELDTVEFEVADLSRKI